MTVFLGLAIILGFALFGVICMWVQARHDGHRSGGATLLADAPADQRSLAQMVSQITPKNRHDEISPGASRGREVLPREDYQVPEPAAGLRTFFRIMDAWKIDPERSMAIIDAPKATFFEWKRDPEKVRLTRGQFERLSYVFGIYAALQILLPDPAIADTWVSRPNEAATFAGHRPIELMASGELDSLRRVREYLDAQF